MEDSIIEYASVCSGIEAATQAWHPLGWKAVWFSQYDPENNYNKGLDFPSETLKYHYPTIPNLGDMTKLRDEKIYQDSKFNVLVGGTPCQSFSIAGLRKGLGDERGNLALEFVRILIEKQPEWFLWENVPGVLSSGSGEEDPESEEDGDTGSASDFACIISAFTGRDIAAQDFEKAGIIEGDFYSIAWRILDSQHFGVPQRRRRIFVVGHLGKDWRPPVAVLFEQDSLRGNIAPGGKKRKGTSGNTLQGIEGNSERVVPPSSPAELANTLNTKFGDKMGLDDQHINSNAPLFVPHNASDLPNDRMTAFGQYVEDESSSALKKRDNKDATDLILIDRAAFNQGENALYDGKIEEDPETSPTLVKRGPHAIAPTQSPTHNADEELTPRLTAGTIDCRNDVVNEEISGTLQSKSTGGHSLNYINPVIITETQTADSIQGNMIGRHPENGPQGSGISEEVSFTLTKGDRHGVVHSVPCEEPKAFNVTFCDANGTRSDRPDGGLYVNETCQSKTLPKQNTDNTLLVHTIPQPIVLDDQGGDVMNVSQNGTIGTLRAQTHGHEPIIYDTTQVTSKENGSNPQPGGPCHPLTRGGHAPLLVENIPTHAFKERGGKEGGGKGYLGSDELAFTLSRFQDQSVMAPVVEDGVTAFGWQNSSRQGDSVGDVSPTLDKSKVPAIHNKTLIRRLTPKECLRLQGFPDDYLENVPGYSDSKAYSAIGNSMTVNVMAWLGKRIDLVHKTLHELKSKQQL